MAQLTRDITHTCIYGETGAGKSSGAATWEPPLLVCFFDPRGKERPYLVRPHDQTPRGTITKSLADKTPVQTVTSPEGALLIRVEHYIDADPRKPDAYGRFRLRMESVRADIERWGIRTLVVDSVTFMELASRKQQQYVLNPTVRDPRQWFGGATDELEEMLVLQLGALDINIVVIAHIDEERVDLQGAAIRVPSAPGRLARRRELPSSFAELYRAYVQRDERGTPLYVWQTRSDGEFIAASQLGAPNPCPQDYRALWIRPTSA